MAITRSILGAVALSVALVGTTAAQERSVQLYGLGGGWNGLTHLNDAGTADFHKLGFNVGGGVGVQVHDYVTLRGDFTWAQNELRTNAVATGDKLNRFFYGAAIQLQYPSATGMRPYLFAGGGAVTLHEVGASGDKTKAAGTFGLGLNYTIPRTQVGLFVEGKGWMYKLSAMSGALATYDKVQVEAAWSGGVSYRFPF